MKNRIFVLELKRGFSSIGFYCAVLILIIAGITGASNLNEIIQEIDYLGRQELCMEAIYQGIRSDLFKLLLPIVSTIPMSASYLEDCQNRVMPYIIYRTTKQKYWWSIVWNCGLFGGLVVLFSIMMLSVVNYVRYPMDIAEFMQGKMVNLAYHLEFLEIIFILYLNGFFYAIFGGVIAIATNNSYMAYAAPFILYYVVSTLISAYIPDMWIVNPREWMMVEQGRSTTVIGIIIFLIILAAKGYAFIIERRWRNE